MPEKQQQQQQQLNRTSLSVCVFHVDFYVPNANNKGQRKKKKRQKKKKKEMQWNRVSHELGFSSFLTEHDAGEFATFATPALRA